MHNGMVIAVTAFPEALKLYEVVTFVCVCVYVAGKDKRKEGRFCLVR